MKRLFRHIRNFGFRQGLAYWRIENRIIRDPMELIRWAECCENQAKELDSMNQFRLASGLLGFAKELRQQYNQCQQTNNPNA